MQISNKKELREKVLTLSMRQEEEKRLEKSLAIKHKLFNLDEFKHASSVLFYASIDGEVITTQMINESFRLGKTVGLPYIDRSSHRILPRIINNFENDIENGPYGIKQPILKEDNAMDVIDMVIVPAVAFDMQHNRLGRGGGYYDRFLSSLSKKSCTVGLAFDFQIVDCLPQLQAHDVPVMHVLTN